MIYNTGPVVIIEDDDDDQEFLKEAFSNLGYPNQIVFFSDAQAALEHLQQAHVHPFLILSDINMQKMNGFDLRKALKENADMHLKCIPYLFFSTASNQKAVIDAYSISIQGFFIKQNSVRALEKVLKVIMDYWIMCRAPNSF